MIAFFFGLFLGTPIGKEGPIKVYVWGEVKSPGMYSFFAKPEVVELISVAGGPTERADLSRVILIRAKDGKREKLNAHKLMEKGELVLLMPRDVLLIPTARFYRLKEFLVLASQFGIFVNLAVTITLVFLK